MSDETQSHQTTSSKTLTAQPQSNDSTMNLLDDIDPNTPYRELYDDLQRSIEAKYMISTLESGWKVKKDSSGRIYYAHPELKITQWDQPEDIRYLQLKRQLEALQREAATLLAKASPKP
jgi:hypothetical protein